MSIYQFLQNPGSTTKLFKQISVNYDLEVLEQGQLNDGFQRIVTIALDGTPVMVGLSYAACPNFVGILQGAKVTPIGTRLFAPDSGIIRSKMSISKTLIQHIPNFTITNYLNQLGIEKQTSLYYRLSEFKLKSEQMTLTEYVLPGLAQLLSANNSR